MPMNDNDTNLLTPWPEPQNTKRSTPLSKSLQSPSHDIYPYLIEKAVNFDIQMQYHAGFVRLVCGVLV